VKWLWRRVRPTEERKVLVAFKITQGGGAIGIVHVGMGAIGRQVNGLGIGLEGQLVVLLGHALISLDLAFFRVPGGIISIPIIGIRRIVTRIRVGHWMISLHGLLVPFRNEKDGLIVLFQNDRK
jgi:hypothetical protein